MLARLIAEKLGEEKVEPEVRKYLEQPVERLSLIVMSYVTILIIVIIIFLRLLPV